MNEKKLALFHDALEMAIDKIVSDAHFVRQEAWYWVRDWKWKTDSVHLILAPQVYICINLYVELPSRPGSDVSQHIAFENLGYFGNQGKPTYRYPTLFRPAEQLLKTIEEDLKKGMDWIDQFNTAGKCLAYLQSDRGPHATPRPGSPSYNYCVEYLRDLLPAGERERDQV